MARPTKLRRIENLPSVEYFLPSDKGTAGYTANVLKLEELRLSGSRIWKGLSRRMRRKNAGFKAHLFRILSAARERLPTAL